MLETKDEFNENLFRFYEQHGRHDLPWRQPLATGQFDPYHIMVSELMLQQTQVIRVIPKFIGFITQFPSVQVLADSELGNVLRAWSGLGYNRRAKFLWQAAQLMSQQFANAVPANTANLVSLPGIGNNTAGAILAYAYNEPVVFIETNVRTVIIHHFFSLQPAVSDSAISGIVTALLDREHPREWYWAVMDYGSHLKRSIGNISQASAIYKKQSTFSGSKRQIRGQIIKLLSVHPLPLVELQAQLIDDRVETILNELTVEGLITKQADNYQL
jgi:A/G-specific adenine glycosylase